MLLMQLRSQFNFPDLIELKSCPTDLYRSFLWDLNMVFGKYPGHLASEVTGVLQVEKSTDVSGSQRVQPGQNELSSNASESWLWELYIALSITKNSI